MIWYIQNKISALLLKKTPEEEEKCLGMINPKCQHAFYVINDKRTKVDIDMGVNKFVET